MTYVGVEELLVGWLHSTLTARVVTDVPANLQDLLGDSGRMYRVVRVGGPSHIDNPRFDLPTVTLDSFGADRATATEAALDVDEALRVQLPGVTTGGATVSRVETVTGPHWAPWNDTAVRRFAATYRLHVKRRP